MLGAIAPGAPGRVPAASQGTMNNVLVGGTGAGDAYVYYETIAGGLGAGPHGPGASAIHSHMTNTLNTPIEALEFAFPLRVKRYAIRRGTGGRGRYDGGDGVVREMEFLTPAHVTLITERRETAPYGLEGGGPGQPGRNVLIRDGVEIGLDAKAAFSVQPGDLLRIETPGGGAWGAASE
jgi:N-methylhydantoinase B